MSSGCNTALIAVYEPTLGFNVSAVAIDVTGLYLVDWPIDLTLGT